jgi:hypothetical protein
MNKSGQYYQIITRFFLEQRGAPFFLSSTEIDVLAGWEKAGVPVRVVLEGLRLCFERYRKKPGGRGKVFSLVFCRPFVDQAFEAFQERRVGGERRPIRDKQKRLKLAGEVERFLADCPDELSDIKLIYSRAQRMISRGEAEEERLEGLEQRVEALLCQKVSAAERKKIQEKIRFEYRGQTSEELKRIVELKLVKHSREKYRIPHLSLYYY